MATRISSLCRLNVGMANLLLRNTVVNGTRTLYTDQTLGLDTYERVRATFRNQFTNVDGLFRKKMEEVCGDDTSMVFTEDLKAMLHLVQKREDDMQLLSKMITKFNNQSKEMRFGTYVFGPVVMRAFYFLDEPDIALAAFTNPELQNFFHQFTSYKVLLTLLYRHGRYEDMKLVYNVIRGKIKEGLGSPRQSLVLIIAACYKQNTPESYQYALDIWQDYADQSTFIPIRAVFLLSSLAINQNAPHVAIELLSVIREQRMPATRNLKVYAYTKLNRFEEIIPILRQSVSVNKEFRSDYFKDVIMQLQQAIENDDSQQAEELRQLVTQLESNNMINENMTISSFITQPLNGAPVRQNTDNYQNNMYNQNYNQNTGYYQNNNMGGPRRRFQQGYGDNMRRNRNGMRDYV